MGEVVPMKRRIVAAVHRFRHQFDLEYHAGRTPETSDCMAALRRDGDLYGYLDVRYSDLSDWHSVVLDFASDDVPLIVPSDLGILPTTSDKGDLDFLAEAEEYVLRRLNDALEALLVSTARVPGEEEEEGSEDDDEEYVLSPRDRADRAVEVWHNHGGGVEHLRDLIAIEIYDALDHMGRSLGERFDPEIQDIVTAALQEWRLES